MNHKSLSVSLILVLLISVSLGTTHAAPAEEEFLCQVDDDTYTSFADAIAAVPDGGTITALRDFTHTEPVTLAKSLIIDTDGHEINLSVSSGNALKVMSGAELQLAGGGDLNLIASQSAGTALQVTDGTATVSNVSGISSGSATPVTVYGSTSDVTITGDVYAAGATAEAVFISDGNTHVGGDVVCENGGAVFVTAGTLTIEGDVTSRGDGSTGVLASDGTVTVEGRIIADVYVRAGGTTLSEEEGVLEGDYRVYSGGSATVRVRTRPAFRVGTEEFLTLDEALLGASDGDTIEVVNDYTHTDGVAVSGISLTFDTAGHKLRIDNPSGCALQVTSGASIDLVGEGQLDVTGDGPDGHGVHVDGAGSSATVSNATVRDSGNQAHAAYATNGGTITVTGDAETKNENMSTHCRAAQAEGANSSISVGGDAISAKSQGVYCTEGAHISVAGDVSSHYDGVYASDGATATVGGSVTSVDNAVQVGEAASATVDGNCTSTASNTATVSVSGADSSATVVGDVIALGASGKGATVGNMATVTIEGDVSAPDGTGAFLTGGSSITLEGNVEANQFLMIQGVAFDPPDAEATTTREGYQTYTDGSSVAWVALPRVCSIDSREFTSLGDALSAATDGETITLLADIDRDRGISIADKSVTFSLGGFTLNVTNNAASSPIPALEVGEGAALHVEGGGAGTLTVTSHLEGQPAVHVLAGAEAELSEVNSLDTGAGAVCAGGSIRIAGDISSPSAIGVDVSAGGAVSVDGTITADQYLRLNGSLRSEGEYDRIDSGYYRYTDGSNVVDVAVDQCIIPGCSTALDDGGFVDFVDVDGVRYYHVSTPEQLAHVADHLDKSFLQTADIDLTGISWAPLGLTYEDAFWGNYDGDGHAILGLSVDQNTVAHNHSGGLFGFLRGGASVKNLTVSGDVSYRCSWYATATYVGGIAAAAIAEGDSSPLIDNCSFRGNASSIADLTVSGNSMQAVAGGIVGMIRGGTVRNCSVDSGTISAEKTGLPSDNTYAYAGGVAGSAQDSQILNSYVGEEANVDTSGAANIFSGGIVGQATGECDIAATYFTGEVSADELPGAARWIGGICGGASQTTEVSGSHWNADCAADLGVGDQEQTRDDGALSPSQMKTLVLWDLLNEALDDLADTKLFSWTQVSGEYPRLSGEHWSHSPPPPPSSRGGSRIDAIPITTEVIGESVATSTPIGTSRAGSTWVAGPTSPVVDALLREAMSTGGTGADDSLIFVVDSPPEADEISLTLLARDLETIAKTTDSNLEFCTGLMDLSFDAAALAALAHFTDSGSLTVNLTRGIPGNELPGWAISIEMGSREIARLDSGHITVRIPHRISDEGDAPTTIIRLLGEGSGRGIQRSYYDGAADMMVLRTDSTGPFVLEQRPVEFADVPEGAWYHGPVRFIAAREITSGTDDNRFSPEAPITRAEFVVLAMNSYRLDRWPSEGADDFIPFVDVNGTYYEDQVNLARRLSIVSGFGDDRFLPEQPITRQEAFAIIRNLLGVVDELPAEGEGAGLHRFIDVAEVAPWATDAVSTLVAAEIVRGDGSRLRPRAGATRAEMAQLFFALLTR